MKNLFCLVALVLFSFSGYSQVKIITNGNVGVGTTAPAHKLDVNGNAMVRGRYLVVGKNAGAQPCYLQMGAQRTAPGQSYVDLLSGDGQSPFGTRLGRYENGVSVLEHKGVAPFLIRAYDAADMNFYTNSSIRLRLRSNGLVGVGRYPTTYNLEVNGTAGKTSGGSDWVQISDERLKTNVREYTDGIDQIMALKPVWFQYNGKAGTETGTDYVGLIAQDLQKVAPYTIQKYVHTEIVSEQNNTDGEETFSERPTQSEEYLAIDASAIRYMLVNAVQEHQDVIAEQQNTIEDLTERLAKMESQMNVLLGGAEVRDNVNNQVVVLSGDKAELQQNNPNPFSETTFVNYFVPENVSKATIEIYDLNGQMMKEVRLNQAGQGQLTIKAKELAAGTYIYKLVTDGRTIDTKKMVLTK